MAVKAVQQRMELGVGLGIGARLTPAEEHAAQLEMALQDQRLVSEQDVVELAALEVRAEQLVVAAEALLARVYAHGGVFADSTEVAVLRVVAETVREVLK